MPNSLFVLIWSIAPYLQFDTEVPLSIAWVIVAVLLAILTIIFLIAKRKDRDE